VVEYGSGRILEDAGLGHRMKRDGFVHDGVNLAFAGSMLRIDFKALTGKHVIIYGQTEVQKDLYDVVEREGIPLIDEALDVDVAGITTEQPVVSFTRHGERHDLGADYVVGCDGVHGTSRAHIPGSAQTMFERLYPFVWVGVLSETPPVNDELIYANHPDGFALCSMRHENLSRYYVQGAADDTPEDWPDDRFWEALMSRLPDEAADVLVTGPSIEKIVTPLRSWVSEPLRHGRLFLAGDAAHIVPPTGAKGLNLAISDVAYLAGALDGFYNHGTEAGLDQYSELALARVWKAVRFSWWMTSTMHRFPGMSNDFDRRLQRTELEYLFSSENARRSMAENYVGLPL
jgi:p-hydroxybenzoate 3-monooxygenase